MMLHNTGEGLSLARGMFIVMWQIIMTSFLIALLFLVSGYTWDDISPCVDWMSPFIFSLRESMSPSSSIAPSKPMDNVSPDDVHNIQCHSIELAVLERAQQRQAILLEQESRQSPDLMQNTCTILSNVEMTPMEDSDYFDYPQPNHGFQAQSFGKNGLQVSPSSSVFMSPKVNGDGWWFLPAEVYFIKVNFMAQLFLALNI